MNNIEIERILGTDECVKKHFVGVFANNRIPKPVDKKIQCFVCNLDNYGYQGSHWIAIILIKTKRGFIGEYFDPLGLPPITLCIRNYLVTHCDNNWQYNDVPLQNQNSNICGQFCCYFLISRCRGRDMNDIVSYLNANPDRNCFVLKYFSKHLIKNSARFYCA